MYSIIQDKTNLIYAFLPKFQFIFEMMFLILNFIINIMIPIFLLCSMILLSYSAPGSPTWSATGAIKTGQQSLFSSIRYAGTTSSFTVNFPSFFNPATINPYLVYGIQRYRATDYLIQESFILTLTSQDYMSFIIQLQITGITNPLLMAISYMAVDPAFPYFFNAYTEVPLNYNSVLSNFSTASASLLSHLEVVDYADQTAMFPTLGPISTYTSFSAPFNKYKIVLFLTSISVATSTSSTIQLTFDITTSVLSATTYSMYATLGYNATIAYIQFSQVFFDSSQFSLNGGNYLNFQQLSVTNTAATTFFSFNSVLQNNFMMGLKSFSAASGQCLLDYQWIMTSISGNYGSQLQISSPYIVTTCGLKGHVSSILLMMKWSCPTGYPFFDLATQICLASCNPYSYLNTTDSTCYPCINTVCYTCNANNSNICLTCATNYQVVNNTCICDTSTGVYYFINGQCLSCGNLQSNCVQCSYTGNTSLAYNSAYFMCFGCNSTAGFFIDPNNNCVGCSVSNCATCLGYATCATCNSGYGVTSSGACSTCPIAGCQACSNLTVCSVCSTGYNNIGGLCYTCPTSCSCGGYTMPRYANGDCSALCGDGIIIFPYEACDDGNSNNGDGCSSSCQLQANSSCSGQPSVCYFTASINAVLVDTLAYASPCNIITLKFKIVPYLILQDNSNISWFSVIVSQNTSVLYSQISSTYNSGIVSLTYAFNTNLQGFNLIFTINPTYLLSSIYLRYTTTSNIIINVLPSNNIPAVYMNPKFCSGIKSTEQLFEAQAGIGYLGLLLSLFSCKIIGLEMFGVLQLSYFSLSNYDYVPPALMGVLQRKEVNGLNIQTSSASDNNIPSRVSSNGYIASDYLTNINIMLLITAVIAAVGIVMYMVTYLINKDSIDEQNLSEALDENSARNQQKGEQTRSQYWHRISKYILKQVLLTFVIFNIFNISYSAGIQIKYVNDVNSFSIICLLLTFTLIVIMVGAQLVTSKQQFGQYIDKFKREGLQSRYMIATIVYRFTLGFLLAVINDWIASGIVFTFVSAAFLTYICYCEPFNDAFQNTRSKFVHSVHVLILFVNFYYRAESNSNVGQTAQLSLPAYIQISAVVITVIGSTILLAYQFAHKYILKKEQANVNTAQGGEQVKKEQIKHQQTVNVLEQFN